MVLVKEHGLRKWAIVAGQLKGRSGKQCRERFKNQLDPTIRKDPWTPDEDRRICLAQRRFGNRWTEIAKLLPGRCVCARLSSWVCLSPVSVVILLSCCCGFSLVFSVQGPGGHAAWGVEDNNSAESTRQCTTHAALPARPCKSPLHSPNNKHHCAERELDNRERAEAEGNNNEQHG